MTVYYTRLDLSAEIEGVNGRFPISSCTLDFACNQIPNATVQIAVGRDAVTTNVALIHRSRIKRLAKAKIYMRCTGQFSESKNWPNKEIMVFEGRVIGPGQVVGSQMSYTLTLVHWLYDLHQSSTMSSLSHPANPAEATWHAVSGHPLIAGSIGSGLISGNTIDSVSNSMNAVFNKLVIAEDVWGKGLKQILCTLANQKHIGLHVRSNPCLSVQNGQNKQAIEALSRIDGEGAQCSRKNSSYAPKLTLGVAATPDAVVTTLFHGFMTDTISSYISQTFWSTMIQGYCSQVFCSVVPLVDHALFVPVTPGLRATYCKTIDADDYDNARFVFPTSEPLRAVGVLSEKAGTTNLNGPNTPVIMGVGGCFAPADSDGLGTIRIIRAPTWLNNVAALDISVVAALGMGTGGGGAGTREASGNKAVSSAFTPSDSPDPSTGDGKIYKGTDDSKRIDDTVAMFRAYAQSVFVTDSLRGRVGSVLGKLRFDIAPGSSVRVQAKYEPFIGPRDQLVNTLIGTVTKVTITLDADNSVAMTAFEMAYLRTEEENTKDAWSMPRHPLFQQAFVGAPLIDELGFGACKGK